MKIASITIGGWFQRTMLQLSEVYDFLRGEEPKLKLDSKKFAELRQNLNIGNIEYGVSGEEFVYFTTSDNVAVKIFEDGLITLNNKEVSLDTFFADIQKVQDYYEKQLSPALNYLFSLGAPVPKELAGIKSVYPYFIVLEKATQADMQQLLSKTEGQQYFEFKNSKYDVLRGNKYYFINNKTKSSTEIERYIEEQIFMREFKGQLHRYLNIHRIIWEKIDDVKEHSKVKGSEIVKFTTQLESYAKTINLIDGRINQMGTYLPTREKIAKDDKDLAEFLEISGYRYETLRDTLEYIKYLWDMTENYVRAAEKQFAGIKSDVTSKSVTSLTIVTSMSAGAAILSLFTESEPEFTTFGFIYFFILALIGWGSQKILSYISKRQKYDVTDVEYEKNIK
ncbi:MAG: hypothetical protein Q4F58_02895 [Candidatus Saccharibacteria bacterium]|nr:hypothetical protein [Candidatus Saccharibacteria bacterium]